jgi:hypothetical protein
MRGLIGNDNDTTAPGGRARAPKGALREVE